MAPPVLSIAEITEYLRDKAENNYLLSTAEFSSAVIAVAIDLAISEYNTMPPLSAETIVTFPSKAILMSGTLYKLFLGQSALLARNTMEYTDGGLSIPVEERFQLYQALGSMYQSDFTTSARNFKTYQNIESGWGGVFSDYATMPVW